MPPRLSPSTLVFCAGERSLGLLMKLRCTQPYAFAMGRSPRHLPLRPHLLQKMTKHYPNGTTRILSFCLHGFSFVFKLHFHVSGRSRMWWLSDSISPRRLSPPRVCVRGGTLLRTIKESHASPHACPIGRSLRHLLPPLPYPQKMT